MKNRLSASAVYLAGHLFREFGTCEMISLETEEANGFEAQVFPNILNASVRDTIYLCVRDENDKMISLPQDQDATEDRYEIEESSIATVYNLRTSQEIIEFNLQNPMPRNIKEVFDRIAEKCPKMEFHQHAYKTAKMRDSAYRKIGYDRMLFVLKVVYDEMLPFYEGKRTGISEKGMFEKLRSTYNIEVSVESDQTMKMYGYEREVTIEDTKYQMTNHIKFNKDDCRIHFIYIEEKKKIYFGHCGKHLNTVSG